MNAYPSSRTLPPDIQQAYFAHLAQGQFMLQHCEACDRHVFYPRVLCVHCGSDRLRWSPARGGGTVYATSVVRRKPELGGDYNVALIDLDEEVRMMSRVDSIAPERVAIGMRVRARIAQHEGAPLVVFDPEDSAP